MKKKNIRSEYIKKLMEDKESISTQLEETTKDTLKEILGESVNKELRNILNESDEDDFDEEEVETEEVLTDNEDSVEDSDLENAEDDVDSEMEDVEDDVDSEMEDAESVESSDDTEDEDVLSNFDYLKDEEGEYDLTGMEANDVIKILQVMKPEDGVRVVKNDNGTITLSDDETDREYIIDIDGNFENTEDEIEVEFDDIDDIVESVKSNLGYTTKYQTNVMPGLKNHETAPNGARTWDDVPTGTERPYGNGVVSEDEELTLEVVCDDTECEVNETMTTQEGGAYNRGVGMYHGNSNKKAARGRNASAAGQKISGTADNSYTEQQLENIKRKANVIFNENKQLKEVLASLKGKLEESIVINASLGKIIQLVTENTTSRDEKVNIVKRFNNVKTIQESRDLYNTISNELKTVHSNTKTVVNESMDKQIAEGKNNNIIETSIYKSTDLSNTIDLMNRMMNL